MLKTLFFGLLKFLFAIVVALPALRIFFEGANWLLEKFDYRCPYERAIGLVTGADYAIVGAWLAILLFLWGVSWFMAKMFGHPLTHPFPSLLACGLVLYATYSVINGMHTRVPIGFYVVAGLMIALCVLWVLDLTRFKKPGVWIRDKGVWLYEKLLNPWARIPVKGFLAGLAILLVLWLISQASPGGYHKLCVATTWIVRWIIQPVCLAVLGVIRELFKVA